MHGTWTMAAWAMSGAIANAAVVNGGFEAEQLTPWAAMGAADVEDAAFGSGPVEGARQALVVSAPSEHGAASFEAAFGLEPGTLDALQGETPGGGVIRRGSGIAQEFEAMPGDAVEFEWNFLTNERAPEPAWNDAAMCIAVNRATGARIVEILADTYAPLVPSSTVFTHETGFATFRLRLPSGGAWEIGLVVFDVNDLSVPSGLLVDDVRVVAGCAADVDGSGAADVSDLLAFLASFSAGAGDLDGNGATEVGDLLAFLTAFRTAC